MTLAEDLEAGAIGFFLLTEDSGRPDLDADPFRGHVRIDGHHAVIDLLVENHEDAWRRGQEPANAIVAAVVGNAVLFTEVVPSGRRMVVGGYGAAAQQYRARTVIGNVPLAELASVDLLSLEVKFLGIGGWAGMTALTETPSNRSPSRTASDPHRVSWESSMPQPASTTG